MAMAAAHIAVGGDSVLIEKPASELGAQARSGPRRQGRQRLEMRLGLLDEALCRSAFRDSRAAERGEGRKSPRQKRPSHPFAPASVWTSRARSSRLKKWSRQEKADAKVRTASIKRARSALRRLKRREGAAGG